MWTYKEMIEILRERGFDPSEIEELSWEDLNTLVFDTDYDRDIPF
jgi:hypothetical protein